MGDHLLIALDLRFLIKRYLGNLSRTVLKFEKQFTKPRFCQKLSQVTKIKSHK